MEKEPYRPGLSQDRTLVDQLKELQKNPNSLVFAALGERYRTKGLVRQGLEILDEGLAKHPEFAPALVAKARCLFDLRRYADCLEIVEGVLRRNPENIKAEKLRAELFQRLGQKRAAIGALTRVIGLVPNDRSAHKALEELKNLDVEAPQKGASVFPAFSTDMPDVRGELRDFEVRSVGDTRISELPEADDTVGIEIRQKPEAKLADSVADSWDEEDEAEASPIGGDITFATKTVAELYLRQGLEEKAKRVVEMMLRKTPGDAWALETLRKFSISSGKNKVSQAKRTQLMLKAQYLERMLARVQSVKRANYYS